MRLSHIDLLDLPAGDVHAYTVELRVRADRPLPVSFDQRRHVGEGDRAGSWMAIALRLPHRDRTALAAAWDRVVMRHPTLHTVFARDGGEVVLHDAEVGTGRWRTHPVPPGETSAAVIGAVFDEACRPFGRPSHALCVVEPEVPADDGRSWVVIGSDHAHVDMWSLVVLGRDLQRALDGEDDAGVAAAFAAHTAALAEMPPAPEEVREGWHEAITAGGGAMPVFPLPLGDLHEPRPEVVEIRDVLDADGVARLDARAAAAGVRATAVALSALTEVSLHHAGVPLRAVFPVHSRTEQRWRDSVGWFITNSILESADPDPVACAAALKRTLALGSYPLAPLLAPWGGMPATPGMFAVSWLDLRRMPVSAPAGSAAHWVSARLRVDGVMVWFVLDDTGLHLRCRHPDTPQARASMAAWLSAVSDALVARAA